MTSILANSKKSKALRVLTIALAFILIFAIAVPTPALAANGTYRRTGYVYPDIIGLGASDTISWTVTNNSIRNVVVSQRGGSCLGVINVVPNGYYMKNSNTVVTKWKLTLSVPVKIFNLEKGIKYMTVEYKLGTNGSFTMRIVR